MADVTLSGLPAIRNQLAAEPDLLRCWSILEFLVWDGSSVPTAAELQNLPTVMHLNTMLRNGAPFPRPYLWIVITARKDQVFSQEHGEVVARGVRRAPSGDHRGATAFTEVGAGSTTWAGLCNYLDHLYQRDLQATLDALSTAAGEPGSRVVRGRRLR